MTGTLMELKGPISPSVTCMGREMPQVSQASRFYQGTSRPQRGHVSTTPWRTYCSASQQKPGRVCTCSLDDPGPLHARTRTHTPHAPVGAAPPVSSQSGPRATLLLQSCRPPLGMGVAAGRLAVQAAQRLRVQTSLVWPSGRAALGGGGAGQEGMAGGRGPVRQRALLTSPSEISVCSSLGGMVTTVVTVTPSDSGREAGPDETAGWGPRGIWPLPLRDHQLPASSLPLALLCKEE